MEVFVPALAVGDELQSDIFLRLDDFDDVGFFPLAQLVGGDITRFKKFATLNLAIAPAAWCLRDGPGTVVSDWS